VGHGVLLENGLVVALESGTRSRGIFGRHH
jgi:hypothetical protein